MECTCDIKNGTMHWVASPQANMFFSQSVVFYNLGYIQWLSRLSKDLLKNAIIEISMLNIRVKYIECGTAEFCL